MPKKAETLPAEVGSQYQIMTMDPSEIKDIMAENMGGEQLSVSDLTIIKVPSGGGTTWSIPAIDGDIDFMASDR